MWLMNGTLIFGGNLSKMDTAWRPLIGDFNGDGKTDIFWRNDTTAESTAWLMDGTNVTTSTFLPKNNPSWKPSIGDFNNDGKTDIFWHNNTTGENAVWLMNNTTATGDYITTAPREWQCF